MPKASRQSASQVVEMGPLESRSEQLGDFTVEFASFHADADGAPVFKGLPDDRCQSPHWGYVISGRVTFVYADREETFEAGDAYYGAPGHVPRVTAGTELVEFSPTEAYQQTQEAIARNLAAAGA